jgi:hydrogenase nickel incorporation protein HypA/HybF
MHELAIAQALIEQIEREVHRAGQTGAVKRVDLIVGRLSGVHCDSLRFAFELLRPGTPVEGAELQIAEPRAVCVCRVCGAREEVEEIAVECPRCHCDDITLEDGRQLLLQSIEIEEG